MFKKGGANRRRKPSAVRKRLVEDDDDDESSSTWEMVRHTQTKHKILASHQPWTDSKKKKQRLDDDTNKEEQLAPPPSLSVMEQKHNSLMQDFIESQLQQKQYMPNKAESPPKEDQQPSLLSQDAVYQELQQQVVRGDGLMMENASSSGEPLSVMVGGNPGIAEVSLPRSNTNNDDDDNDHGRRRRRLDSSFQSLSSAVPGGPHARAPSATATPLLPTKFAATTRNIHGQHQPVTTTPSNSKKDSTKEATTTSTTITTKKVDDTRTGFDRGPMSRKQDDQHSSRKKNKDDQAFADFMTRQRESAGRR